MQTDKAPEALDISAGRPSKSVVDCELVLFQVNKYVIENFLPECLKCNAFW